MLVELGKLVSFILCLNGCRESDYPEEYKRYMDAGFLNRYQHLTTIGLYLTIFAVSFKHVSGLTPNYRRKWKYVGRSLLCVVLPLEMLITITFWCLYLFDPSLVLSKELVGRESIFKNICIHLVPFLLIITELVDENVERSVATHVTLLGMGVAYYFYIRVIAYYNNNRWAYPFLDHLTNGQRLMCILGLTGASIVLFELYILTRSAIRRKINN